MKIGRFSALCLFAIALTSMISSAVMARPPVECLSGNAIKNAFYGEEGEYEVKEGLSVTKWHSLLNRKKLTPTEGCFLGTFQSGDSCLVIHLDQKEIGRDRADCEWQCVDSDDPGKAFERGRSNSGTDTQNLVGIAGNDFGSGSVPSTNRDDASRKYFDDLKNSGLAHASYCLHSPYNEFDAFNNKTIFCQCWDATKKKPLFSWEYKYSYGKKGGAEASSEGSGQKGSGLGGAFKKGLLGR